MKVSSNKPHFYSTRGQRANTIDKVLRMQSLIPQSSHSIDPEGFSLIPTKVEDEPDDYNGYKEFVAPNKLKRAFSLSKDGKGDERELLTDMLAKTSLKEIWDASNNDMFKKATKLHNFGRDCEIDMIAQFIHPPSGEDAHAYVSR